MPNDVPAPRLDDHSTLPGYVRGLLQPGAYAHGPATVELIETHISYVFLAGDFVYKTKKPVDLGFIDQVDAAARERNCHAEVRLNRRLAPSVYLGVTPVVRHVDGSYSVDTGEPAAPDETVEWAVKMTRLPEERTLENVLEAGELPPRLLERLVAALVPFHAAARVVENEPAFAGAAAGAAWWAREYAETRGFTGETWGAEDAASLRAFIERTIADDAALFDRRLADGRVVEGHGDLRLKHVYVPQDEAGNIDIVDCLEFSEAFQFRYQDVGYDIAFLAMDLEAHGRPDLGDEFVGRYLAASGDETLGLLQPFHRALRAFVRGKVDSVSAAQPGVPPEQRELFRESARRYFRLASEFERRRVQPSLILMCGPPGTGKSTVGGCVAGRGGAAYVSSDVVRKELAGMSGHADGSAGYREGIYSPGMTERTYEEMRRRAKAHLAGGHAVVLDAVHGRAADQAAARDIARDAGVPFLMVSMTLPEAQAIERIAARRSDPMRRSDADEGVYRRQAGQLELIDCGPGELLALDAAQPVAAQAREIAGRLLPEG